MTDAERTRESMLSVVAMKARMEAAEALLGRWMFWASGVTFKSEYGEAVIADTDWFLALREGKGRSPVEGKVPKSESAPDAGTREPGRATKPTERT